MVSLLRNKLFRNCGPIKESTEENVDINGNMKEEEILQEFRKALKESKYDLNISMDDDTLMRFLRIKSFKINEAIALIHRSEEMRRKNPHIFNIPFCKCKTSLDNGHLVVLRQRDFHGRRIIVFRTKYWIPEENPLEHVYRILFFVLDEVLLSAETQSNGIVLIFDNADVSIAKMAHIVSYFTFRQLSRLISFCQGGFPVKMKGLHVVPTPFIVASTYQAVKFLVNKKMRTRVFLERNLPDFLEGDINYEKSIDKELIKALYSKHSF